MLRPRSDFEEGAPAGTLADDLRRLGLPAGATILVHAALRALGPVTGGGETLLEALQMVIGDSGTIMVPAFCWDAADPAGFSEPPPAAELEKARARVVPFTPDAPIDPGLGVFPQVVHRAPGAMRSSVPASFAALGKYAEELTSAQDRERPYGPGSPLGRLAELDGWVLLLGVDFRSATSVHCAEDHANLPYLRCDPPKRYLMAPDCWLEVGRDYDCGEGFNAVQGVLRQRGQLREGRVGAAWSLLAKHNHIVESGLLLLAKRRDALLCRRDDCAACSRARRVLTEEGRALPGVTEKGEQ
jgi:aminoglycoside 3-N-acetyltransferase